MLLVPSVILILDLVWVTSSGCCAWSAWRPAWCALSWSSVTSQIQLYSLQVHFLTTIYYLKVIFCFLCISSYFILYIFFLACLHFIIRNFFLFLSLYISFSLRLFLTYLFTKKVYLLPHYLCLFHVFSLYSSLILCRYISLSLSLSLGKESFCWNC